MVYLALYLWQLLDNDLQQIPPVQLENTAKWSHNRICCAFLSCVALMSDLAAAHRQFSQPTSVGRTRVTAEEAVLGSSAGKVLDEENNSMF